jgi:hypothetical protein
MPPPVKTWRSLLLLGFVIIWGTGCAAVGKPMLGSSIEPPPLLAFDENVITVTVDDETVSLDNALSFSIKGIPVTLNLRGARTPDGWQGEVCATLPFLAQPVCVEAEQEKVRFSFQNNSNPDPVLAMPDVP